MEFSSRFSNWVHWCLMKGMYQAKAGSAEGNYRSGQVWEERLPKPEWLTELDIPDAVLVNRAYGQLGDTTRRTIKVLWFRHHWKPQWQAQKLGCHYTELAEKGFLARKMLENRLDFIERPHKITRSQVFSTV